MYTTLIFNSSLRQIHPNQKDQVQQILSSLEPNDSAVAEIVVSWSLSHSRPHMAATKIAAWHTSKSPSFSWKNRIGFEVVLFV